METFSPQLTYHQFLNAIKYYTPCKVLGIHWFLFYNYLKVQHEHDIYNKSILGSKQYDHKLKNKKLNIAEKSYELCTYMHYIY